MYSPNQFSALNPERALASEDDDMTVFQEVDPNDPIRLARNNWRIHHAHVSDSSAIIDSIDVDMIDAYSDENNTEVYIVLDTNILIHQLSILKQVLIRIDAAGAELSIVLLVPGIVVSELDHQKNGHMVIANESRRASDWLAHQIGNGRGRVKGQAYTQTMLPTGDWRQRCGLSNDELILDCCKYFSHIKRKDVLLYTNDNNLAVQASSNARNLFVRDVSAVVRPHRKFWDSRKLLERAIPGVSQSLAASVHASGTSKRHGGQSGLRNYQDLVDQHPPSHPPTSHRGSFLDDDAVMELDLDSRSTPTALSGADRRDVLHRQMCAKLTQQLRILAAEAASLQRHRREHESLHSYGNTKYKGKLPTEQDWNHAWSLRQCLNFVAKIPPPQPRYWTFGEAEASSLADFLGTPGEKGARPGREWAKNDWERELLTVQRLGLDFNVKGLGSDIIADHKYDVMEAFAVD